MDAWVKGLIKGVAKTILRQPLDFAGDQECCDHVAVHPSTIILDLASKDPGEPVEHVSEDDTTLLEETIVDEDLRVGNVSQGSVCWCQASPGIALGLLQLSNVGSVPNLQQDPSVVINVDGKLTVEA